MHTREALHAPNLVIFGKCLILQAWEDVATSGNKGGPRIVRATSLRNWRLVAKTWIHSFCSGLLQVSLWYKKDV